MEVKGVPVSKHHNLNMYKEREIIISHILLIGSISD
jgi:hypothetical protein